MSDGNNGAKSLKKRLKGIAKKLVVEVLARPLSDKCYTKLKFRYTTGCRLNLTKPVTFSDKLQWLKLHDRNPKYKMYADKYLVREYVQKTIGAKYLNEMYGVYDSVDDIDLDTLPESFTLKCTHASGFNVIVEDKGKLNVFYVKKELNGWLKTDFFLRVREWPYKNTKHRIIAEKYLGKKIIDYKFYCFDGEPRFLYLSYGDGINGICQAIAFMTLDWKPAPFYRADHPVMNVDFEKPDNFDEMKQIVSKLAKNIPFVRIDLFNVDGRIYFSEMTLYPAGGCAVFSPPKYERSLGDYIDLNSPNICLEQEKKFK